VLFIDGGHGKVALMGMHTLVHHALNPHFHSVSYNHRTHYTGIHQEHQRSLNSVWCLQTQVMIQWLETSAERISLIYEIGAAFSPAPELMNVKRSWGCSRKANS
jgi:hypothetical protein